MNKDVSRTVHAQQAIEITELFSYKFGALRFGTSTPRLLKLLAPDGPSTGGGVRARQSIVLQGEDEGSPSLVLGWVDTAQFKGEVKALGSIQELYKQRFHGPLDLEEPEYQRMVDELTGFLKIQKIALSIAEMRPTPLSKPRPSAEPEPTSGPDLATVAPVFLAGVVVGLLLGYVLFAA